ncbi:MAG TPA: 1,4-dihydroxy-6-naphthoate synthase [Candidatus Baltobacteraceae bacterium]|nr:1,4-dihydroxy-6-naphthoate synthase [Candidatus Baltobacteraceae bacterium]
MIHRKSLTLAYSPCPNDTYIFAALTNNLLDGAPQVRVQLEDIENLNNSALKADYELTKVSYGAIPLLMEDYRILRAGGALGRGCGPLLITRKGAGTALEDFRDKLIAIPGEMTTAFMLLRLAMGKRPQTLAMRFDQIVEAIANGTADAGLIIHESRFTYHEAGLVQVIDLGDWWESQTGMPIPLGAILVRRDLDDAQAHAVNDAIVRSLRFAREHEPTVMKYVREHATEMQEDVMRKHIDLYVNEFSEDVGDEGLAAVKELFSRAHAARIVPQTAEADFV